VLQEFWQARPRKTSIYGWENVETLHESLDPIFPLTHRGFRRKNTQPVQQRCAESGVCEEQINGRYVGQTFPVHDFPPNKLALLQEWRALLSTFRGLRWIYSVIKRGNLGEITLSFRLVPAMIQARSIVFRWTKTNSLVRFHGEAAKRRLSIWF
jgi:hypothetical protein